MDKEDVVYIYTMEYYSAIKKNEIFFLSHFFFLIYFWDTERQSTNGGGTEREGDTESETGSRL